MEPWFTALCCLYGLSVEFVELLFVWQLRGKFTPNLASLVINLCVEGSVKFLIWLTEKLKFVSRSAKNPFRELCREWEDWLRENTVAIPLFGMCFTKPGTNACYTVTYFSPFGQCSKTRNREWRMREEKGSRKIISHSETSNLRTKRAGNLQPPLKFCVNIEWKG